MPDLDTLPLPAYDLLPVERYGARSVNHPRLAAIELGRGCFGSCDFCVLWRQMGRFAGDRLVPHLRVKSPERLLEEIRLLVRRYHRALPGLGGPVLQCRPARAGPIGGAAAARRHPRGPERLGAHRCAGPRRRTPARWRNCVRSGLNEVYLGIERPDGESLASLHKTSGVAACARGLAHPARAVSRGAGHRLVHLRPAGRLARRRSAPFTASSASWSWTSSSSSR